MYAIKMKEEDIWLGMKDTTYFVRDDASIKLGARIDNIKVFGVPRARRRIFETTDQIRRSLAQASKETVTIDHGFFSLMANNKKKTGSFSLYEVHDLTNGTVHSLEDVFEKKI